MELPDYVHAARDDLDSWVSGRNGRKLGNGELDEYRSLIRAYWLARQRAAREYATSD